MPELIAAFTPDRRPVANRTASRRDGNLKENPHINWMDLFTHCSGLFSLIPLCWLFIDPSSV
jgi:hypothetical protein